MGKKKKIALVSWIGGPNYGTVLQSWALYSFLRSLGHDVRLVRRYSFVWGVKKSLDHVLKPLGVNILKTRDPENDKFRRIRQLQKDTFRFYRIVGPFGKIAARFRFDVFVCGSDQIWNVYNCFDPYLFLDFAGSKPRISYAASIGTADIMGQYRAKVAQLVNQFSAVSVREVLAADVLSALTGRNDIVTVLDPTLLYTADQWREFASSAELSVSVDEPYILVYLLGRINDPAGELETLKAETGISRVIVLLSGEYPDLSVSGAEIVSDAGAREFVAYLDHASYVLTDSFHGTAFSINLSVPYRNLKRFDDADVASQNSRLDNLRALAPKLEDMRKLSEEFLVNALK